MTVHDSQLADALASAGIERPTVITLGTFDGVHLGHRRLIEAAASRARDRAASAVAITFHPRPAEVLRPDGPSLYLCSLDRRVTLLRQAGADIVVPLAFTRELSLMTAFEFVDVLVRHGRMIGLLGGPDLALGHGRQGTVAVLRDLGQRLGFDVEVIPPVQVDGQPVRSSVVHRAIQEGDVERAARLLGYRYRLEGVVVKGDGRGQAIGFPTANIALSDRLVVPANGVYAVFFSDDECRWPGAANLGTRPTFGGSVRLLEVHLIGFTGDLYGRHCSVEFVQRLRPEQRFASVADLVAQIRQDIEHAEHVLSRHA